MPAKLKRPCRAQRCPNYAEPDTAYCAQHAQPKYPVKSRVMGDLYKSRDWLRLRAAFLAAHPTCALCKAKATIVDHIVSIRHGGAPFDIGNLQPLCYRHHQQKNARGG